MPVGPAPTTVSLTTTTEEFRQLAGPEVASFQFAPPNSSISTLYVELSMNWDSEVLWVKAERRPPGSLPRPPSPPVPPVKLAHAVEVAYLRNELQKERDRRVAAQKQLEVLASSHSKSRRRLDDRLVHAGAAQTNTPLGIPSLPFPPLHPAPEACPDVFTMERARSSGLGVEVPPPSPPPDYHALCPGAPRIGFLPTPPRSRSSSLSPSSSSSSSSSSFSSFILVDSPNTMDAVLEAERSLGNPALSALE